MSWYKQGEEGTKQAEAEDERRAAQAAAGGDPRKSRFWLKPKSNTQMTFLDGEGFFLREHQFYKDGSWINFETCIQDIGGDDDCPFCEAGNKYSYVAVFTIIDHTRFTSRRSGKEVKAQKRLAVFKSTARNKIIKQKERRGGDLTGCLFEVNRYDDKECSTGEDFEFLEKVDVNDLKQLAPDGVNPDEFIQPFNYVEIFQPKSADELRRIMGAPAPVGHEEEKGQPTDAFKNKAKRSLQDLL